MSEHIWPDPCGCQSGTEANGWHERRCEPCRQIERDQWRRAMAMLPTIIEDIRSKR